MAKAKRKREFDSHNKVHLLQVIVALIVGFVAIPVSCVILISVGMFVMEQDYLRQLQHELDKTCPMLELDSREDGNLSIEPIVNWYGTYSDNYIELSVYCDLDNTDNWQCSCAEDE